MTKTKSIKIHPNYLPAELLADWPKNSIITENGRRHLAMTDEYTAQCVASEFGCECIPLTTIPGWFGIRPILN